MAKNSNKEKQQAHELVDQLPPTQLKVVVRLLEEMLDPVSLSIANAPVEDEPLSEDEKKALDDAREWLKRNQGIPHAQILAELGISQKEIDSYKETK
jgi:hypothetical protein